jgi:ABC-type uncharacterized transport system involved in gliding motility auxiliary subunit
MLRRILNILGWVGTALVVAALVVRLARPDLVQVWNGLAIAGLVTVLLYIASQWREIAGTFSRRQARYGALSIASVLIVLAILVAVNYIASRQNKRWDLTEAQQFTLSDQTRRILQSLDEPVHLLVFDRSENFRRFRDRLAEYEDASRQVRVEYVDADREPARARQYQVQTYGTIVVEHQGRIERVTTDGEQDITNAIIRSVEGEEQKVYFTQGHGEKDPASADERTGYNTIADALRRDNFIIEPLVLAQRGAVPADASVVVIAGPTADFLPAEIDALRRFLDGGGKVLFMLDPPEHERAAPLTNLLGLVGEWGFDVGQDIVLDPVGQAFGTGASVPVAASFPAHPITDGFRVLTAFPLARSVNPAPGGVEGRFPQTIVETSPESFAKTDLSVLRTGGAIAFDEARDRQGPISLAAALAAPAPAPPAEETAPEAEADGNTPAAAGGATDSPPAPETRIVVFGDSDFVSNAILGIPGNADLFLNTVNWLAEQEGLIAIRPREPADRRVTLTTERQRLALYLTLLVIPGVVFAAGAYTWWRRR